jgi:sugar phosphate isomerase/epimerase
MVDYSADWVLKDYSIDHPDGVGNITREELMRFFGTLGIDGVELMDDYWADMDVKKVKQLVEDCGLPIVSYLYCVDLAFPDQKERQGAIDRVRRWRLI